MPRLSISFTEPNDQWLQSQVDSKEYTSKSDLVNELIRRERKQKEELAWLRAKLERAENSGYSSVSMDDIKREAKEGK